MLLSGGNRLERALLALTATQSQTGYLPVPFRSTATRYDGWLSQGNLVHRRSSVYQLLPSAEAMKKGKRNTLLFLSLFSLK